SSAAGIGSSVVLLITRGKLAAAAAASLMAMDQVLVGIVKLLVLILALFLVPEAPENITRGAVAFAALTLLFLGLLLATAFTGNSIGQIRMPPNTIRAIAVAAIFQLSQSLGVLRSPRRAGAALLLALAKKSTEVAAALAVQLSCGIEFSPVAAILVVAAVGLSTAVPIIPGSFGVYTTAVFVVYDSLGVATATALAAGVLQHLVEVIPSLLVGYVTFFVTRFSGRLPLEPPKA
ncbi:MAG: flippase-like domain-containing protein, partial [Fimbriimonadaceae bacterium]|nr:flippase-like domain-containing protein [Alphaproteobacteria bacterium]